MSTPRNDSQPTESDSTEPDTEPGTDARDGSNLADVQRDAETLRARQQQDFARYREKLSAEVAELQAALSAITADESAPSADFAHLAAPVTAPVEPAPAPDPRTTSRRTLLKWGGLGAAAATFAAAGGATLSAPTARAADGGNVILGASNQGEHTTEIAYDGAETNPVVFRATVGSSNSTAISATVGSGTTDTTSGVAGSGGTNGKGVRGTANGATAFGVWGVSDSGFGVVGESGTGIDLAATGTGRLLQASSGSAGAPSSGSYSAGEQIRDAVGALYICVTSGSPGVWMKVVGQPVGYRGGTITFLPTPIRVYDSRPSNNPLVGNGVRNVQVTVHAFQSGACQFIVDITGYIS